MKLSMKPIFLHIFLLCPFFISHLQAANLIDVYTMARDSDPTFKAAFYQHQAGQEFKILGRSNLLPVISANYSRYKNEADIDYDNGQLQRSEHREYASKNASIQLRQPLINFDSYARYKQGEAQTSMSDQEFIIREQELILRVFNKYAAVLYAEDLLALSTMKKQAYAEERQANITLFKHGEGTKTDILESQARYDLAEADIVEARDNLDNTRASLNKILGRQIDAISPLLDNFSLLPMKSSDLDELKMIAVQNNLEIIIQRYMLEVAEQELNRSQAGHMPRLDAVVSWSDNASDTTNTYNQQSTVNSVGLQLTVPIYSGGSVSARVRQSQSNLLKAKAEFDEKSNIVVLELQEQFNLVSNAQRRLKALETAVNSALLLVKATKKSIKGGTRTTIDVLNTESQLFEAKGDLLLARYNYLQSYLNLKKVLGTLGFDDLEMVATRFQK
ncbi:MAG TPA: hypothetical protein ENH74_02610 [Methylophaga sp.]|nr:hypothetical protein [Methylophaga sp.]HEC58586.1 hypothetical protein [Methylophaga sp.]